MLIRPMVVQRWPDYTVEPVYSGHPSRPNQLAAIQRWPDYTVEPVYSGHPSRPNELTAIQRWPDYTVEPVYSGHPSRPNQLAAIQRWPDYTVHIELAILRGKRLIHSGAFLGFESHRCTDTCAASKAH